MLAAAIAERRDDTAVQVHDLPPRYVASEGSALVHWLNGRRETHLRPTAHLRARRRCATLVNNVETLAHLGLIARRGADWYRAVGDRDEPGTPGFTVSLPGRGEVIEVPTGTRVGAVLETFGVTADSCSAVLVGGFFGSWLTRDQVWSLP